MRASYAPRDSRRIAKCLGPGSSPPHARSTLEISRGGSIDAFIRPIIVRSDALPSIANIYTTEHAALIFIACKLLQRPRFGIGAVFATIGPIFRALSSSDSLPLHPLPLLLSLSLSRIFAGKQRERERKLSRRCIDRSIPRTS